MVIALGGYRPGHHSGFWPTPICQMTTSSCSRDSHWLLRDHRARACRIIQYAASHPFHRGTSLRDRIGENSPTRLSKYWTRLQNLRNSFPAVGYAVKNYYHRHARPQRRAIIYYMSETAPNTCSASSGESIGDDASFAPR